MKKITLLLIALCLAIHIKAQGETLKELVAEGNKAYVELVDVKKNIPEAQEAIHNILVGEEWNRWQLVDSKEEADFILKVSVEKKGVNLLSLASDGARVRVIAEVSDLNGKRLWKSKRYQGNASIFTGFSALDDAMRKLVRRALKKGLLEESEK